MAIQLPFTLSIYLGTLDGGLGCFPLDNGAYPPLSHCPGASCGIRGLVKFGRLTPPYLSSALPPQDSLNAVPKYISGRTSYLRVRLAFYPYPQLIPAICNLQGFGPPRNFTFASTWPRVAHLVSRLPPLTMRPIQTRFRFGFGAERLNLASEE